MDEQNYLTLLKKAKTTISKKVDSNRFQVPKPEIIMEGKITILKNFKDTVDTINRDKEHIYKYLLKQFGVSGDIDDSGRLILKGKILEENVEKAINEYLRIYVQCYECGSYDTELVKQNRNELVHCKACGAERPLFAKREIKSAEEKVEEGKEYEVTITDVNRDGDGVAIKGEYTIIIPGAKKGEKARVKIEKIKKNYAIGQLVK